ncbi:hypothetical protein WDV85_05165 [Pseudokineococcus sp. 5B2Z-1]
MTDLLVASALVSDDAATALAHDLRLLARNPAGVVESEHLTEVVTP